MRQGFAAEGLLDRLSVSRRLTFGRSSLIEADSSAGSRPGSCAAVLHHLWMGRQMDKMRLYLQQDRHTAGPMKI